MSGDMTLRYPKKYLSGSMCKKKLWRTYVRTFWKYSSIAQLKLRIWRHINCDVRLWFFLWNIVMLYIVGKLSLRRFRIAIETGSENEVLESYSWFYKVTWPFKKWKTVSREPLVMKKSFCTLISLASSASIKCFIYFMAKKWMERPQKWEKPKKSYRLFFKKVP